MDMDDEDLGGGMGGGFGGMPGFGHVGGARAPKQDPPAEHELFVSLEELLVGTTKRLKITRKRINPDRRSMREETKILENVVKPGYKAGTKIKWQHEGDEAPGKLAQDIHIVIRDKPHINFTRDPNGVDLHFSAKVCTLMLSNCRVRRYSLSTLEP